MATLRNLKIKTSSCRRIVKEFHSYEKEVEREASKTADMKAKGADPYDLKQQHLGLMKQCFVGQEVLKLDRIVRHVPFYENVLSESRMMIPDCLKRLEAALEDLKGTLSELEESDQKEGPEIDDARSTIAEVEQLLQA